ncbi:unnamed protein product, partial [Amoebophrya sp. A120]|eukprot:GSA120T00005413001.1
MNDGTDQNKEDPDADELSSEAERQKINSAQIFSELQARLGVPGRRLMQITDGTGLQWLELRDGRMVLDKIFDERILQQCVSTNLVAEHATQSGSSQMPVVTTLDESALQAEQSALRCLTLGGGLAIQTTAESSLKTSGENSDFRVILRNVVFSDAERAAPILQRLLAGGEVVACRKLVGDASIELHETQTEQEVEPPQRSSSARVLKTQTVDMASMHDDLNRSFAEQPRQSAPETSMPLVEEPPVLHTDSVVVDFDNADAVSRPRKSVPVETKHEEAVVDVVARHDEDDLSPTAEHAPPRSSRSFSKSFGKAKISKGAAPPVPLKKGDGKHPASPAKSTKNVPAVPLKSVKGEARFSSSTTKNDGRSLVREDDETVISEHPSPSTSKGSKNVPPVPQKGKTERPSEIDHTISAQDLKDKRSALASLMYGKPRDESPTSSAPSPSNVQERGQEEASVGAGVFAASKPAAAVHKGQKSVPKVPSKGLPTRSAVSVDDSRDSSPSPEDVRDSVLKYLVPAKPDSPPSFGPRISSSSHEDEQEHAPSTASKGHNPIPDVPEKGSSPSAPSRVSSKNLGAGRKSADKQVLFQWSPGKGPAVKGQATLDRMTRQSATTQRLTNAPAASMDARRDALSALLG